MLPNGGLKIMLGGGASAVCPKRGEKTIYISRSYWPTNHANQPTSQPAMTINRHVHRTEMPAMELTEEAGHTLVRLAERANLIKPP